MTPKSQTIWGHFTMNYMIWTSRFASQMSGSFLKQSVPRSISVPILLSVHTLELFINIQEEHNDNDAYTK